ncbi:MAG TPA: ATP-dependent DNA ligase LigA [Halobacteriales archaeon]|nr:ATP-dependent DNA ligase LigA [Halobacteriales archaeon]
MEFAAFAERAAEVEAEPADLEIVDLVTRLLADAGEDLPVVARFVQGRVFPGWSSETLDVGPSLCYAAIARAAGQNVTAEDVEERLAERGEIGEVAASYDLRGQRGLSAFGSGGDGSEAEAGLTVAEVDRELRAVADAEGPGSQDRKLEVLFGLFSRCSPSEARYLARIVLSEMRIGVGGGAVRDAIAQAFDVPVDHVERAVQLSNDYGLVAETAREQGVAGLDDIHMAVGRPVQSMLAQSGTVTDALDSWGEAAVEWKLDGARVQVHYDGDAVRAFSRNLEDVTDPLPEVVEFVEEHLEVPAILDGEVVAVDESGDPLPFQEVLRRFRRKYDVERAREEVGLEVYAFDCLHADGDDLIDRPYVERREALRSVLSAGLSEATVTGDAEEVEAIERAALEAGHEGIMLKNPESAYTPGRRGKNWLKRKPDVETLDLVVTGAEWGEGRRAKFLGTYELSVVTDGEGTDGRGFLTIGNVATGITDEELAELTALIEPHVRSQSGKDVDVEPTVVFEVGYEEIQRSPTYESGYALRFPRFVAIRDDKDPEDADTLDRVERLADGG